MKLNLTRVRALVFTLTSLFSFPVLLAANLLGHGTVDAQCIVAGSSGRQIGYYFPIAGQTFITSATHLAGFSVKLGTSNISTPVTASLLDLRFDTGVRGPIAAAINFTIPAYFGGPDGYDWLHVHFVRPVNVALSGRYALELSSAVGDNGPLWQSCDDNYVMGSSYSSPLDVSDSDMIFMTFSDDYPPVIITGTALELSLGFGFGALSVLELAKEISRKVRKQRHLEEWSRTTNLNAPSNPVKFENRRATAIVGTYHVS